MRPPRAGEPRPGVIPNSFTFDHCGPMAHRGKLRDPAAGARQPRREDAGSIAQKFDYRAALDPGIRG
ncbi:MAG: hypothetical protein KIT18_01320 [Burkholderiales bacterium]|nr:hypothetical protein [Burkholderiales bacterium]